ncbi:MAG: NADH-quinone oxidoreductase subunit L [Myxococcales bacterium]|nr:NADH-quinone oxidoreductase subunit L [Myxococcales bacterium]
METTNFALLGLIPLLPALGALINGVLGRSLPRPLVALNAVGSMATSFLLALLSVGFMVWHGTPGGHGTVFPELSYQAFTWFAAGPLHVDFGFALDPLSSVMILIITGVGTLIHIYSAGYMWEDPGFARYFAYLNFFCFAMLCLVLGDNLVVLFLGWEGVGVASYLLIGFWYEDDEKASAGKKAFITNRVGDFAVVLGLFLLFQLSGSLAFADLRSWVSMLSVEQAHSLMGMLTAICLLLFVGCTGKSAQIPLYVWLPDAMAGPTPVSALIHAATMVTAGVYLIARLSFLFVLAPHAMAIIATVGALTAFFAATIGATQYDIKKVLAYSTVSQLGYMFLAVGSGAFFAGVFHLMTHAFFKALLFLGSGSVIHGMHHEQDMRKIGGLRKYMPITAITYLIGCFAIAGLPFVTSGFYSKDEILWFAWSNQNVLRGFPGLNTALWAIGLVTAGLTAFYMFRSYFMTFEGECRADEHTKHHIHESPITMTGPLVILAGLSLVGGFVGVPHILGGPWLPFLDLHGFLHQVVGHGEALYVSRFDGSVMTWVGMGIAIVVSSLGIGVAWMLYGEQSSIPAQFVASIGRVHTVIANKYYVDELYAATVGRGVRWLGVFCHRVIDVFLIDQVLVQGTAAVAEFLGAALKQLQNGDLQRYAAFAMFGLGLILLLLL